MENETTKRVADLAERMFYRWAAIQPKAFPSWERLEESERNAWIEVLRVYRFELREL